MYIYIDTHNIYIYLMLAVYGEKLNHVTTNFGKKCRKHKTGFTTPPVFHFSIFNKAMILFVIGIFVPN